MEYTREIYWNVGHGVLTLLPMYLLALAAVAVMVWGFWRRRAVYRLGKPLQRLDRAGERIIAMLAGVLSQKKVARVVWPGLLHALFFWGFLLLVIGTTLVFVQADFTDPLFDLVFLKGTFYLWFSLTLDLAGLIAIIMLGGLFVRRYLLRPEGLTTGPDDAVMHGLLFVILVSGFVIEGARMAVTELGTPLAAWSPVGLLFAKVLSGIGEDGLRQLHKILWWVHLLLAVCFIAIIPFTKFRHIFTTSANYLLADRGPKGKLATLDLENEETQTYGAKEVTDLSWKDIFDADACTLCKRCQDRCPAYATGKPLSPMKLVNQIGETAFQQPDADLVAVVGRDVLWACTTCRACQEICPAGIEHIGKIIEMRRSLVLMEGEFPGDEVMAAMEQTEVNGNPLGSGYASRGDWADGLEIEIAGSGTPIDILYFVGCYASFDKRNVAVAKSFIKLCRAAGLRVGILGKQEKCCGEPMRKMGNEYLYQTLALENIEQIVGSGATRVVATCPHCYNTLNKDYRDLGLEIPVESSTVFLERLIVSGKLTVKSRPFSCTYHDSCYLGRHNDIYEAPRRLIAAAGGTISEMEKCRDEAFCCSAGGGRILAEESLGERISIKRVQMAAATGAPQLLSSCPFCLTMFEDGVKGANVDATLKPRDIAEVLADCLPEGGS